MNNLLKYIPAKYTVLAEPCQYVGEKLGMAIARGWEKFVDSLIPEKE